ncbi:hypothetical protein [Algoriphagus vanfongensis]|uniref:hypothetical protein n=1 Tax=Algoriphagus vanfongensis TaxID=426371 RepID=UPI000479E735|nr:hypothetical protein [Algoriphagus vanfongensis]
MKSNTFAAMEATASFILILGIYFMGTLAIIQQVIHPKRELVPVNGGKGKTWVTNYAKIIGLSFLLSAFCTSLAYILFI